MTIGELKKALENHNEDSEIRIIDEFNHVEYTLWELWRDGNIGIKKKDNSKDASNSI